MPKMSRKLSLDENEEIEFVKKPKIYLELSPEENEEIEVTIQWVEELNKISKQIGEIKSTIKKIEEEREPRGSQSRSDDVIETDKSLMSLKREYDQMVRNYNKKYQKQGRIRVKRLERVKFSDEIGESKSWGELDQGMHKWVHYMFYTFHLDLDIPGNAFN